MPFFAKKVLDNGVLVKAIDSHLNERGNTLRVSSGWNSPSSSLICLRETYFMRTCPKPIIHPPRTQRIFDNGDGVHERLQDYLKKEGVLLLDEAIVFNKEHEIHGRTDGILKIGKEIGILEIKSMNEGQFRELTYANPQHESQAMIYAYCINDILAKLKNGREQLEKDYLEFISSYVDEDKISSRAAKFSEYLDTLEVYKDKPITKVFILYENKNNQMLKEFIIKYTFENMEETLNKLKDLNNYINKKELPQKITNSNYCDKCKYKKECNKDGD